MPGEPLAARRAAAKALGPLKGLEAELAKDAASPAFKRSRNEGDLAWKRSIWKQRSLYKEFLTTLSVIVVHFLEDTYTGFYSK